MWSLFGYAVVFLIVSFIILKLWALRYIIFTVLIVGTLAFFITNYKLRNADMSDENVKKTTEETLIKGKCYLDKLNNFMEKANKLTYPDKTPKSKPVPEPEGFAVTK